MMSNERKDVVMRTMNGRVKTHFPVTTLADDLRVERDRLESVLQEAQKHTDEAGRSLLNSLHGLEIYLAEYTESLDVLRLAMESEKEAIRDLLSHKLVNPVLDTYAE